MQSEHIDEELLERYVLKQPLEESLSNEIAEHLLFCSHCQDRYEEIERFRDVLRKAHRSTKL